MTPPAGVRHLPDEELLAYLERWDGEDLAAGARGHLRECGECARRAEWLRRRSAALDARIAELEPPPGRLPAALPGGRRPVPARAGRPLLRAAALVAGVLLAGTALAGPLRARALDWAAARWEDAVALLGGRPAARPPASLPADTAAAPTEYRFLPEGSDLRLEIAAPQASGTVTVVAVQGDAAMLAVTPGARGARRDPVLLLPDRVRIDNAAASTASYRLAVPAGLRTLRVRVGAGPWSVLRPAEFWPGEQRVLPLGGGDAPRPAPPAARPRTVP